MLRIVEHLVGQPVLDDGAALHDHQPVRQQAGDAESPIENGGVVDLRREPEYVRRINEALPKGGS